MPRTYGRASRVSAMTSKINGCKDMQIFSFDKEKNIYQMTAPISAPPAFFLLGCRAMTGKCCENMRNEFIQTPKTT